VNTDENITNRDEIESIISTVFLEGGQTIQRVRWKNKDITIKWILNLNFLEGVIILWDVKSELTTWEKAAIEQSATIVSLEIEHLKTISSTIQHFRNEFISDLLCNKDIEENVIFRRAQEMGWTLKENYKVILLDYCYKNYTKKNRFSIWQQKNNLLELMQNKLVFSFPEVLLGLDKNNYFALLVTENINIKNIFRTIEKILTKYEINFAIGGIGRLESIYNLDISYKEAYQALNIAKVNSSSLNNPKHNRGSKLFVLNFSELGIERIIFSNNPENEINHLKSEVLQEVIDYDNERNSDLILTLQTYLKHNGNIHSTAKSLFVHKNTVRYRLNIIEKLTGLDLSNLNDQLLLHTIFIGSGII